MKILKIELQNINSLKSETPIAIDFENEKFKDVGLYAITGATGAGKTTVLDAITIALYHNVPRFNNTKGALLNVVSHEANEAFSRVTFENDNTIYEAFWSIRVADKNGKIYKNPKEEVSLKNLTANTILATQKRDLITQINTVTRLNYNQFLRSVMLAQGEFASFLTAKGPDKGKLLEQITGEKIYKKIGQSILERKSAEENKLKEIQAKINADDVLNEVTKTTLIQKDKSLDKAILNTEKEIKLSEKIVDWYLKEKELNEKTEELNKHSKVIDAHVEKHKNELELLRLDEKASPFKELLQEFNRTEKEFITKNSDLKKVEHDLIELKPKLDLHQKQTTTDAKTLETANKTFSEWLPKFDLISRLDNQLKNEVEDKQTTSEKLTSLSKDITLLQAEEKKFINEINTNKIQIEAATTFLKENSALKEVDAQISNWTQDLTTLKAHKKSLQKDTDFIVLKNKEIAKNTSLLKENTSLLEIKQAEITKIEKEHTTISEKLVKNNITKVLTQKNELDLKEDNWKLFKNLSEQTIKATNEQNTLEAEKKTLVSALEAIQKEMIAVTKAIEIQEKLVADASKILDLEKSIAKYENDRQHLVSGEPCGLCGATEHPFTDNLKTINVSASEIELNNRKEALDKLVITKNDLDKKEVQKNTSIQRLTSQVNNVLKELQQFKSEAKKLHISYNLVDSITINNELKTITAELKLVDEIIKTTQELQSQKNQLSEVLKTQNSDIGTLKTTVAKREEKLKNVTTEINTMQKSINGLTKTCDTLATDLASKLAKFNYELPDAENTNAFIENVEKSIVNYTKSLQLFNNLTANQKVLNHQLSNIKKQQETIVKTEKELIKAIANFDKTIVDLKKKRNIILPENITVSDKRDSLQQAKNKLTEKLENSKRHLQKLLDINIEKDALKIKITKEQKILTNTFTKLKTKLDTEIINSNFSSKEALAKALLSPETKLKYTNNKEKIKNNQIKLKTLKEANLKAKTALNTVKNFEITNTESKLNLESLHQSKKECNTEKGKIAEAFRKDNEIKNRNKDIYKQIEAQEAICNTWRDLFKILGGSKDAFNVYVQRLTLKHLLDLANVHLYKLNKRYSLKMEERYKPKEELNFNLIDHYQTDQERLVDTSSGGEKFIISLALALGLSDLASKNVKIDSLFIDEGFGTLDKNTLETVISTLETLQSQGKMIGIISHVENLKERISTQIKITKKSNGISVVNII